MHHIDEVKAFLFTNKRHYADIGNAFHQKNITLKYRIT